MNNTIKIGSRTLTGRAEIPIFKSVEEFAYRCKSLNSGSRKQQISFASLLPEVGQHKSAPSNTITKGEPLQRLRGEGSAFVTPRAPARKCANIGGSSEAVAGKQEQPLSIFQLKP